MRYKNLNDLINSSNSSREYFLSLPAAMQIRLHEHSDYIHSAFELHRRTDEIKKHEKSKKISESLF